MDDAGKSYPALRLPAAIFLFSILFVLLRLFLIFHPQASGWSLMVDELPTGNVALDLETGLVMPLPLYQTKPFAAGTLWEGLLSYPMRQVFGPVLFSLKMTAVLWNLIAMALWMTLAWKYFSRGSALIVGLLFSLSPPFYVLMTMTAWGNHCETSLMSALCLICLMSAMTKNSETVRIIFAFAAGLSAGLGLYLSYSAFPLCVFSFFVIALIGGRFTFLNILPAFTAGLIAGIAPLAWSLKYYGFEALGMIDTYTGYTAGALVTIKRLFLEADIVTSLNKFIEFWTRDIWHSCLFAPTGKTGIPGWLYLAATFLCAVTASLWNGWEACVALIAKPFKRKTKEETQKILKLLILAFPIIFSLIYAASGFRVLPVIGADPANYANYRYLAPVYPFFFLIIAAGFGNLWQMAKQRWSVKILLGVFGLIAVVFLSNYYRHMGRVFEPAFDAFLFRGDAPEHLMDRMAAETAKVRDSYGVKLDRINRLRVGDRGLLFELMSRVSSKGFDKALLLSKDLDKDYRPILYRGLSMGIAKRYSQNRKAVIDELVQHCFEKAPPVPEKFETHFLEGVGWGMSFESGETAAVLVEKARSWNTDKEKWREALKKGIGRRIGSSLFVDSSLMEATDSDYEFGLGAQLRRNAEVLCVRFDFASEAILAFEGQRRKAMIAGFVHEGRSFFDRE